jgi:hypothetical protein
MRLAAFVLALLVFVASIFIAQHSLAAGASSSGASGGGSHGGGSSSSGSASHSSAPSVSHSTTTSAAGSKTAQPSMLANNKGNAASEKKTGRSFFHPFRKPVQRVEFRRPCLKEPCSVCPPGGSRFGKCLVTSTCVSGQVWNGFSCVASNWWFNDCSELAAQLAAQARHMQGTNDPGQAFVYQMLKREYDLCMERAGHGLGSYATDEALLFDTP